MANVRLEVEGGVVAGGVNEEAGLDPLDPAVEKRRDLEVPRVGEG